MPEEGNRAYVTVATDDSYALGALVLAYSLKQVHTQNKLVILVTPEVSDNIRVKLRKVFDDVKDVTLMESNDDVHLSMMDRPELGKTFTKLHIWKLTEYSKCVFLDADTLVIKNCDELFEREELSAVPDVGWPDCFNSGVFVFIPCHETYRKLIKMAAEEGSFDGGDQGLLNTFFSDWATRNINNHLSFIYNMVISASYTYVPAYKHYGHKVKIIHFLGTLKPWMHRHPDDSGTFQPCENCTLSAEHLRLWWDIYSKNIAEDSTKTEADLCEGMCSVAVGECSASAASPTPSSNTSSRASRQSSWEQGQIDYLGVDCFENIQRKLEQAISTSRK